MPSDTTAPAPPQLGNYDIVSKIADGGMGTVYKAKNRLTGQIVALKVIAPATAKNPILLQRFKQEFEAAKVLDHPNVVKAMEYHGAMPHPFLVMEFVDGESLGQRMERKGAFAEAEAVHIIAQVCEGLQRAHKQGLVHRDVKPDNILVTKEGLAKLTDMGLVKDVDGDLNLTKTGRGLGTPHYMAPEQFRNAKSVDVRGDIYSLGATLYALVTGLVPFENASPLDCWMKKIRNEFPAPKELNPKVSDRVDWAIRRAMSAEPDRRPASCREFLEDLTGQSRNSHRTGAHAVVPANPATDIWYMVYKDETGAAHTVKGSTEGIRNALQNHLLGDATTILVSRTKTGQFAPLMNVPEFRDLVVNPAPLPAPGMPRAGLSGVLAKASGVVPQTTDRRKPGDADAVDLGKTPSGTTPSSASNRNRGPAPGSARHAALPPEAKRTPTSGTTKRIPASPLESNTDEPPFAEPAHSPFSDPNVDPQADTELYVPTVPGTAPEAPMPEEAPREAPTRPAEPFNATPFLVALVLLLSAAVCYLLLTR
jgi:serine/threonine protein kinase